MAGWLVGWSVGRSSVYPLIYQYTKYSNQRSLFYFYFFLLPSRKTIHLLFLSLTINRLEKNNEKKALLWTPAFFYGRHCYCRSFCHIEWKDFFERMSPIILFGIFLFKILIKLFNSVNVISRFSVFSPVIQFIYLCA